MIQAERQVLLDIGQVLHNLTVKIDSVEGALIHLNLLPNGLSENLVPNYVQATTNDLALLRSAIDSLRAIDP